MVNKEWLDSLKPGDEAIVDGRNAFDLVRVIRRTPTGRIVVKWGNGTREFNPDGSMRGAPAYSWADLAEPTQERRERIERANLAYQIGRTEWRKVPLDTLRKIAALLEVE